MLRRLAPALVVLGASACSNASPDGNRPSPTTSAAPAASATTIPAASVSASAAASAPPASDAGAPGDPMALHVETKEALLALFAVGPSRKRDLDPQKFLDKNFGVGSPRFINQGNKELAKHSISKEQCRAGLAGITLQTDEQRAICAADNMVPIYKGGRADRAKACIDVFEFPNEPCELPFVWVAPVQAKVICELQGKRLCTQEEWTLGCNGDPGGGKPLKFAYGNEMDLAACNTNKPAATFGPECDPGSAQSAWKTCATNTEPAGSFPRCRSRFGVFDQHGNVAEIMARLDPDGEWYDQLKGSAFFYVDVARKPDERSPKGRETYPDHCAYDPRWHVEPLNEAWHVNYHLGFRCCKTVRPR